MTETEKKLKDAQTKAEALFLSIEERGLVHAGVTEQELSSQVYDLAFELYGVEKHWHKRIVRAGKNTLCPYKESPPDLVIQPDDILFFDLGPVFEDWEADFGRTYVLGKDPDKLQLCHDIAHAWQQGKIFFDNHKNIAASEFYEFSCELAKSYGWEYGGPICGHLIGKFPHEKIQGDEIINYIHPSNKRILRSPDRNGNKCHWIYEIHFVDKKKEIGGFYEQLLTI